MPQSIFRWPRHRRRYAESRFVTVAAEFTRLSLGFRASPAWRVRMAIYQLQAIGMDLFEQLTREA